MADTIEQRIARLLREKEALFARVVETASLDLTRLLHKEDLCDLLGFA
jgi:hypothetical protein